MPAARPSRRPAFDFSTLEGLPAPVQRYLRLVLTDGKPMVAGAHVLHRGSMNMNMNEAGTQ